MFDEILILSKVEFLNSTYISDVKGKLKRRSNLTDFPSVNNIYFPKNASHCHCQILAKSAFGGELCKSVAKTLPKVQIVVEDLVNNSFRLSVVEFEDNGDSNLKIMVIQKLSGLKSGRLMRVTNDG